MNAKIAIFIGGYLEIENWPYSSCNIKLSLKNIEYLKSRIPHFLKIFNGTTLFFPKNMFFFKT